MVYNWTHALSMKPHKQIWDDVAILSERTPKEHRDYGLLKWALLRVNPFNEKFKIKAKKTCLWSTSGLERRLEVPVRATINAPNAPNQKR